MSTSLCVDQLGPRGRSISADASEHAGGTDDRLRAELLEAERPRVRGGGSAAGASTGCYGGAEPLKTGVGAAIYAKFVFGKRTYRKFPAARWGNRNVAFVMSSKIAGAVAGAERFRKAGSRRSRAIACAGFASPMEGSANPETASPTLTMRPHPLKAAWAGQVYTAV